jgi:GLPGLI family protein
MKRTALYFLFVVAPVIVKAQIQARAISYTVRVDLAQLDPSFDESNGNQRFFDFEVDAYYTDAKLRTIVRKIGKHADNGVTIRQRLYDIASVDEYNIDPQNNYLLLKKDQVVKPKATGKQKSIMGYACKEMTFTDYRGIVITVWVTDKLPKNICPVGNYSLKGTALEINTSNGLHYTATDFAEGVLDAQFFDVPQGFQQEVVVASAPPKKTK